MTSFSEPPEKIDHQSSPLRNRLAALPDAQSKDFPHSRRLQAHDSMKAKAHHTTALEHNRK
jgi:hypothetical protein